MPDIAHLLQDLRAKGVELWVSDGQLRYRSPKARMTAGDLRLLRESKAVIIADLERRRVRLERLGCRLTQMAPLSFSQLQHWNLYNLGHRSTTRFVASATRFFGRLDVAALRSSVAAVVGRHDALRTRLEVVDSEPIQVVREALLVSLRVEDLNDIPTGSREMVMRRRAEEILLEPVNATADPLLDARLLLISEHESVLIIAMEHIISDMTSLNVVLREFIMGYEQLVQGRALTLPEVKLQFTEYARAQRKGFDFWLQKHGGYWKQSLAGCGRMRFPDSEGSSSEHLGWSTVPVEIGRELKRELQDWCRRRRTTVVMAVFTAYAALVLRWCGVTEGIIQFQVNGRTNQRMDNAIGYFAAPLSLRVGFDATNSFLDLLNHVSETYCSAFEHADFSYFEAHDPRPEFTRNSAFNWVPAGDEAPFQGFGRSSGSLRCSPVALGQPFLRTVERDAEPFMVLFETEQAATGSVYFPADRFSTESMLRFTRKFHSFLGILLRNPMERVRNVSITN